MAVGLSPPRSVCAVRGVQLAAAVAGIKPNQQPDLVLVTFDPGTVCAGVFTRNAFCAAPVIVAKQHLAQPECRALLLNSGNANAGTGKRGLDNARRCCELVADALDCKPDQVLPFSTGVIGEDLPMAKMEAAIKNLPGRLSADAWLQAAEAIMTTDTVAKACSRRVKINGTEITISGIAKGAGMIRPDMATMLAFVATDAVIDSAWLQHSLESAVATSFNSISIDGDTSTNDACVLVATGASASPRLDGSSRYAETFQQALDDVCVELAHAIVRDGEGATKFVSITVEAAASIDEAKRVAYTIAHSPLVKTALFASDPNWGRILAAVGRARLDRLDIDDVRIYLNELCIVSDGGRDPAYTEALGQQAMTQDEITIRVMLNRGSEQATVWTTDLSYDYVKINAEYRT